MYNKEEAKILMKEFWEGFDRYTKFYSQKVNQPIKWMYYKTGVKGLELKFDISKKLIQVLIEVNSKSDNRRFEIYVELDNYKAILNDGFAGELKWVDDYMKEEQREVSRILIESREYNFHNRDHWNDLYKFMATNMYKLQSNLIDILPILREKFH